MSLPAPYSEVYLEGDGVTTEFAFGTNFKPISAGLVKCIVYLEDGYEVVPTYTVNMAVGSITISALTMPDTTVLTAPPLGSTVRIFRDEPEAQPVSASQIQSYTSKQLEILFDAIVAMIQEVSYTVDHKTIRLTEPQRDISLQKLTDLVDGHLIYWDAIKRELVVTNYPQQDVVQCVSGLFFKIETDPNTHNPYLEWSTDNSDWHAINVDAAQALAQDAYTLADDAYNLASTTRGELNAHKADHANPHETSMTNLIDTDFNNLVSGQFLQFDGINWVNVDYNTTVTWGGIIGNIDDQPDLKNALDAKVSTDGSSIMTGPLKMRATSSFQCAIAPYWDGVGFYKLNSDDSVTLIASIETPDGFVPWVTNTYNIGSLLKKWKNLYLGEKLFVSTINNGGDLAVPTVSGTLATKADVDLAANSGRMITDQGVWYAKMYAATVPPAAENGTNYADFSQVDGDNNPIIVIYERQSGAWVQTEIITPPAEYDGYVPITSKIWDIAEQAGQQGGRILWNHQSKEFTPYPQIISFKNINVTGDSTVDMPQNPGANQIVNKDYVDNHIPTGNFYHPDLFDWKWADHQLNDVQWLRGDTFSWQSGAVYEAAYQHLVDDIDGKTLQSETIGSTTIQFYLADDGHKICPTSEESNVAAIYTATGVAWYYIIDTVNERFKLPHGKHNKYTETLGVVGNGYNLGLSGNNADGYLTGGSSSGMAQSKTKALIGQAAAGANFCSQGYAMGVTTNAENSGLLTTPISQDTDQYKYLYFYVGEFTQTAIENTAGLNAELFNGKADVSTVAHVVIEFQAPTADNGYTWYRKYADGWVEQGGEWVHPSPGTLYNNVTITLPVVMADANYSVILSNTGTNGTAYAKTINNRTTTQFVCTSGGDVAKYNGFCWEVKGMAHA